MIYQALYDNVTATVRPQFFELSLDVLSPKAALQLLTALVGVERISQDVEAEPDLTQLCKWLDYQPLGLELVGRYLAENPNLSLVEMLKQLKAQQLQDEALNPSDQQMQKTYSRDTNQLGVKAAFELNWETLDPMTRRVSQLLSLFAPTLIPWELVKMLSATSLQLNWTKASISRAKKQLYKWNLIQPVEDREGCYTIHPLIREFLQAKLAASEQADELRKAFAAAMVEIAQNIPDSPTRQDIDSVRDAIPHLEEVAHSFASALRDEDLLWLFDRLGRFYKSQGLYALAEPWFGECVLVAQARLGNDHPDVATSLNNLAGFYYSQGRYSEAQPLYVQALELKKRLLGDNHPDVAASLNNLAAVYDAQGCESEAEPLYMQALELRKRLLGEDHPDVAQSLNNLALLYYSQGRYSKAEPLYVQALEQRKRLLGIDHPDVATSLSNLALLYYCQGRYSKAEPLLVQALELSERVLGANHPNAVIFRENLATFRAKMGSKNSWLQQILRKTNL